MNKVIFLDVDGVLNDDEFWHERYEKKQTSDEISKMSSIDFHVSMINPKKVAILNRIVAETGAKIVISSTWRMTADIEKILAKAGITGEIIGKTPRIEVIGHHFRGIEIYSYINDNYRHYEWESKLDKPLLDTYVILDDDADMMYWQRHNFFQTNTTIGLTDEIADKVISKLNAKDKKDE